MPVLPVALGHMALHPDTRLTGKPPVTRNQVIRAGRDEAGCDERLHHPAIPRNRTDPVNDLPCSCYTLIGRYVPVVRRACLGMSHRHPAHNGPTARFRADLGQPHRRLDMDRSVMDYRCRTLGLRVRHQYAPDPFGEARIKMLRLERKGMDLQPVLQRHVNRRPRLRVLRRMHLQVDGP